MDRVRREHKHLSQKLDSVLDEIDDAENDRDRWSRQIRKESARVRSLMKQRVEALSALRSRFGEDAVERVAFTTALRRTGDVHSYGKGGRMSGRQLPFAMVADALKPLYEADGVELSTDVILQAARNSGIDVNHDGAGMVSFEEFCAINTTLRPTAAQDENPASPAMMPHSSQRKIVAK